MTGRGGARPRATLAMALGVRPESFIYCLVLYHFVHCLMLPKQVLPGAWPNLGSATVE